ncbi:MAG: alpha/beta hydrolase [Deltaproteobacteria bacterium]|nr:alpha/beta hydrolase [Deltaproteobacteria bacterium]
MNEQYLEKTEKITIGLPTRTLVAVLHLPVQPPPWSLVVISHGLFSSKDSPKLTELARSLALAGWAAIRYDHMGCNESTGSLRETTFESRMEDLSAVIDSAGRDGRMSDGPALVGSSMGGTISLAYSGTTGGIKTVVTWAAPFAFKSLRSGAPGLDHPDMADSFYVSLNRVDLTSLLPRVNNALVIHGSDDELVPVDQARHIFEALPPSKKLVIVDQGDHRFTRRTDLDQVFNQTIGWLHQHFRGRVV